MSNRARSLLDCPPEIILSILEDSALDGEDVRSIRDCGSTALQQLVTAHTLSINRSISEQYLGWHCTSFPAHLVSSSPARRVIPPTSLQLSTELRRRKVISQQLCEVSKALCSCGAEYLFEHRLAVRCCSCRKKVIRPFTHRYISILWRLGDCENSPHPDEERLAILESLGIEELSCLFIGQLLITQSFLRHDHRRRSELKIHSQQAPPSPVEELAGTPCSELVKEEGNVAERMCAFRDLVLRHGPWFLDAYLNRSKDDDDTVVDWVRDEVQKIRAWEEGGGPNNGGSPSMNMKVKTVMAQKMGEDVEDHGIWQMAGDAVWRLINQETANESKSKEEKVHPCGA